MYATREAMILRFGEDEVISLTDRDGSAGVVVDAVLDPVLDDAAATIDGYLAGRYLLPLLQVPATLERIACDLARYYLYDNRLDDSHPAALRHKEGIRYLEQLGSGKLKLGINDQEERRDGEDLAEFESQPSVFSRPNSKGFI
ncbi:gp436 family protein [Endozoicomonas numazuensis]|uniref:Mu-like prophage FluMu protein gp36 n=1 Tax=Endozoicomonas numazuensis TaxID=1137799 RepID=A0A081NL49_9GAMM|nr:phage protein Gp36 family protein [Endozoicomonas numazuensis]KEQ19172.1 hypothetical protein GZ78_04025 [Endozoicomonas numazuensis]